MVEFIEVRRGASSAFERLVEGARRAFAPFQDVARRRGGPTGANHAPLVSIVIPAYNAAQTLDRTLDSVLRQTITDWEVIVVDDGSHDETYAVARRWSETDSRIKALRQSNGGASAARNHGLSVARGTWMMFLDSDDTITPRHLQNLFAALKSDPAAAAAMCGYTNVSPEGRITNRVPVPPRTGDTFEFVCKAPPTVIHGFLVKREDIVAVGAFDESLRTNEDWDLWIRLARRGLLFAVSRQQSAWYWNSKGSLGKLGLQMVKDAEIVRARFAGRDPRVPDAPAAYAEGLGWTAHSVLEAFGATLWNCGVALGAQEDFQVLLDDIADGSMSSPYELWMAETVFGGMVLGAPQGRRDLIDLVPEIRAPFRRFVEEIGRKSPTPGFGRRLGLDLEKTILRRSRRADGRRLDTAFGVTLTPMTLVRGVTPPEGADTVVFRLPLLGSRWRLMLDEPIVSDLSGRQVRKLLASRAMGFLARRLPARHRLQRAAVRAFSIATRLRSRGKDAPRSLASRRAEEWDDVYALEDPWNYAGAYEQLKYDRTLDLLPDGPIDRALELGCSEGWFTAKLAPKVDRLSSLDISAVALERARARCARFDNVEFRREDFFEHDLGSDWSLIVCSETLYYLPSKPALRAFVAKVEAALRAGGCFLHAHHTCIDDDPARTGLDTGVPFGGREVGHAFEAAGFIRERSLATPLYHIDLFRKPPAGADAAAAGPTVEAAPGAPLSPELQAAVVWNGAVRTRREVESERRAAHVPVLMYHRIATDGPDALAKWRVSPEAFEHQLRFLRRRGFRSIGVDQWDWRRRSLGYIPGRPVMLTFDDAQADFHHTAWPILKRNGFTAHVFVVTGKVGGYSDWDSGHGAPTPLMDWDQIIDLSRQGVTFGSHLVSHSNPDAMDNRSLYEEAVQSRETLETRLGCEVRTVATPYAVFNPRIERILQQAGYTRAFADDPYRAPLWGAAMRTPRIEIFGGDDIAGFADKLWCAKEPPEPADVP